MIRRLLWKGNVSDHFAFVIEFEINSVLPKHVRICIPGKVKFFEAERADGTVVDDVVLLQNEIELVGPHAVRTRTFQSIKCFSAFGAGGARLTSGRGSLASILMAFGNSDDLNADVVFADRGIDADRSIDVVGRRRDFLVLARAAFSQAIRFSLSLDCRLVSSKIK